MSLKNRRVLGAAPDQMLAEKDPIAMELYAKYKNVAMPNLRLNELEVTSLIDFMDSESRRVKKTQQNTTHRN